ncbi:hypothetical protein BDB00DRAFT_878928 [Zychaea mexicana]|uniref:uncharacterized protein n=1 Tax=Zychaea mexicana TaxID=64656 RepID=UPI0022FEF608|nr:uncharacterized protein BDB00DRAFT_878928 [Zychaea mexicana]KAI9484346.1 hypothetical protein BDB00DRAFT_878928 [Zychaea mexicana]
MSLAIRALEDVIKSLKRDIDTSTVPPATSTSASAIQILPGSQQSPYLSLPSDVTLRYIQSENGADTYLDTIMIYVEFLPILHQYRSAKKQGIERALVLVHTPAEFTLFQDEMRRLSPLGVLQQLLDHKSYYIPSIDRGNGICEAVWDELQSPGRSLSILSAQQPAPLQVTINATNTFHNQELEQLHIAQPQLNIFVARNTTPRRLLPAPPIARMRRLLPAPIIAPPTLAPSNSPPHSLPNPLSIPPLPSIEPLGTSASSASPVSSSTRYMSSITSSNHSPDVTRPEYWPRKRTRTSKRKNTSAIPQTTIIHNILPRPPQNL